MATASQKKDEPTLEEMREQIATMRKDMAILAAMARDKAELRSRALAATARERVEELSEEARTAYEEARDELHERGERAYADTEEMIRRNPFASVGIAMAAGWLLGKLLQK